MGPFHKSDKEYNTFRQREARMGTYKKDSDGRDRKCCDVGQGCKGNKPDCNNTIMTLDEYRKWKSYIDEKDKNQQGSKVGYYYIVLGSLQHMSGVDQHE